MKLSDDGLDDSFFDDEDALYCYHGPAPSVDYGGLSDSSSKELPELPYTRMTCFMDYSQSDPDTVDMGEAGGRGLGGGGGQGEGAGGVDDSEDELPDLPYTRMTSFRDSDAPSSSQHDHNTEYRRVTGGSDRHGVRVDGEGNDGEGHDGDVGNSGDVNDNAQTSGNTNSGLSEELRNLLPAHFHPGTDGMGACTLKQRQAASYFREPWKFSDREIQNLIKLTKDQFFALVLTCVGAENRHSRLSIFGQCFLLMIKLCHNDSFDKISALFGLKSHQNAADVFYRQLVHQYRTNCNIPAIITNAVANYAELNKLFRTAYQRTPPYFKRLIKDFEDPSGRSRTPVIFNIDGTYFDIEGSSDIEKQKHMYYAPRSGHVAKFINFTDLAPKFVGFLPISSSQTPSSGDGLLLAKHIELEDMMGGGMYVRTLLRGNDDFFVVLVSDAGFVCSVPNAPVESRGPNAVTLASVCEEEHCVLLHTSNKHERYHLERTEEGKIRKIQWTPGNPTLDQNTVKFTRAVRKTQEQIHAALKAKFAILDERHLTND